MYRATDRQRTILATMRRVADAVGDDVDVVTQACELTREEAEPFGADERTRREIVGDDEQCGSGAHAVFRLTIARIT